MTTNARSTTSPVSISRTSPFTFCVVPTGRSGLRGELGDSARSDEGRAALYWWERPPATSGSVLVSLTSDPRSGARTPSLTGTASPSPKVRTDVRTGAPARAERMGSTPSRVRALVGITLALFVGGFGIANAATAPKDQVHSYLVRPGDSFWSIARSMHPQGDVRPLVADLIEAHGSAVLQVGDRLELPSS
jgi:hypothetical protein